MSSYPALDPVSVVNMLENDDPGSSTSSNSRRANNPYAVGAAAAGGSSSGGQVSPQRSGGFSVTMGDGGGGGATETPLELRGRSTANNNMSGMWLNTSLHEDGRSSRNSSHIAFDFPQGPYGSNTTPPMVAFLASSTSHQLPAPQCSDGRTMGCAFAVECDTNDSSSTSSVQSLHHQGDPIYRQSDPLSPHQDTSPMFEPPGWRPLLHKPLVSSPSSPPEGTSNVRSLDSSHSAHTAQSRHNGSHHPSSQGSLSQNGMRAVALAATSAPSQGPTDTSVEELVALLHAAYRDAHGTEFDLRSAPSSPDGEQSHTMGSSAAPPPQPSVDVRCPAGFVFSVYDTDVREHFSVNSDDVVITAGAIKYVEYFAKYGYQTRFRFQYCKRFVGGRCASGNNCHFLHVSHLPASTSVHVNENAATPRLRSVLRWWRVGSTPTGTPRCPLGWSSRCTPPTPPPAVLSLSRLRRYCTRLGQPPSTASFPRNNASTLIAAGVRATLHQRARTSFLPSQSTVWCISLLTNGERRCEPLWLRPPRRLRPRRRASAPAIAPTSSSSACAT